MSSIIYFYIQRLIAEKKLHENIKKFLIIQVISKTFVHVQYTSVLYMHKHYTFLYITHLNWEFLHHFRK